MTTRVEEWTRDVVAALQRIPRKDRASVLREALATADIPIIEGNESQTDSGKVQ